MYRRRDGDDPRPYPEGVTERIPSPGLVGRDDELRRLRDLLRRALGGQPVLALVHGPSGAGSSTLVSALIEGAGDVDVRTVTGLPWESTREFELLRRLGLSIPQVPAGRALHDHVQGAAARVVRQWERWLDASDRPLLVVVRDAHEGDAASLSALSSAVHRLGPRPVMVVVMARTSPQAAPPAGVAALQQVHRDTSIALAGLAVADVARLAASRGVLLDPQAAARLRRHTSGLPRLVLEVLDEAPMTTWGATGERIPAPSSVRWTAERNLVAAGPDARAVVEAAAVLRPWATVREVAELSEVNDPLPPLDVARGLGLVHVRGHQPLRVDLASPLLRTAVLDLLDLTRRRELYLHAARQSADEGEALRLRLLAAVGPDPGLADELEAFARVSARRGAWGAAGDALAGSSELQTDPARRAALLVAAVDAYVGHGDLGRAAMLIPELDGAPESPQRDAVLGYDAILRGHRHEAEHLLAQAWNAVDPAAHPEVAAQICHRRALHALAAWDAPALVEWSTRAINLEPNTAPAVVEARTLEGLGHGGMGHHDAARAAYAAITGDVPEGAQRQRAQMGLGWLNLALDELPTAAGKLRLASPRDAWQGSTRVSLWAYGWLARCQFSLGDWDGAMATVERAVPVLDATGQDLIAPLVHWTGAEVSALRGDWERARRHLDIMGALRSDYVVMLAPVAIARATVALAAADHPAVVRALSVLASGEHGAGLDEPGFWPWHDLYAIGLTATGLLDEADQFLQPHEQRARERGHRSSIARLGAARGRLLGACGELQAARAVFADAMNQVRELPLPYLRARIHYSYGETLRRAGKRREAEQQLHLARDGYAALGAQTYVDRCDRELQAGGLTPRRDGARLDELTPQERSVVDLVLMGRTNREVASQLFISVKTVQYHLTRVYARLGVRSRVELIALQNAADQESG